MKGGNCAASFVVVVTNYSRLIRTNGFGGVLLYLRLVDERIIFLLYLTISKMEAFLVFPQRVDLIIARSCATNAVGVSCLFS